MPHPQKHCLLNAGLGGGIYFNKHPQGDWKAVASLLGAAPGTDHKGGSCRQACKECLRALSLNLEFLGGS